MKYLLLFLFSILLLAFSPADSMRIGNLFLENKEIYFKSFYKATTADDLNKDLKIYLSSVKGVENLVLKEDGNYEFDLKGRYIDYSAFGGNGNTVWTMLLFPVAGKGKVNVKDDSYTVTLYNMYFENNAELSKMLTRKRGKELHRHKIITEAMEYISKDLTSLFIIKEIVTESP